jgi:phosphoribosylaminoimidazole-succinocarboxamide synthase
VKLLHSGKVRDLYDLDGDLLLVASDRLSIYDVVLPTPVPDKGAVLTQLSVWWFDQLADLVPNHLISATDVPAEFAGRALRCRRLEMLPVECIARGYLAGLGLKEYQRAGTVSGVALPPGLVEGSKLPEPIFTPTTKAPVGEHDEFMTFDEVVDLVGAPRAERLRELTLAVYSRGAEIAARAGILVADTKLEFGLDETGRLVLGDEAFTPDSSRFWPAAEFRPGGTPPSFDKQFVRDYCESLGWDKTDPGPELPADVVAGTRGRYVEAFEQLTGMAFDAYLADPSVVLR